MSEQPQRSETVEEYLKRGGKITKMQSHGESPSVSFSTYSASADDLNLETLRSVNWKDIEKDESILDFDDQYWKTLNKKMDEVLKKT
ncbi:MAG: hypothetical protein QGH83_08625 [Candidatus Pacebacteria bacterium]|nr:hypothetical protein [Candidatus Paceibacterota bacterium]